MSQTESGSERISIDETNWSQPTRLLHLGLVITVTAQLGISLVMAPPDEEQASTLGAAAFEAHEILGMSALVIVLLHWLWTVVKQADGGVANLFPWFGKARGQVISEVKALLSGDLPKVGTRGGLPGFIHGLGFLAVSGMAITGGLLFVLLPESGPFPSSAEFFAEIHEFISLLVWGYWAGHSGIALLHHGAGHTTLRDMFRLGKAN